MFLVFKDHLFQPSFLDSTLTSKLPIILYLGMSYGTTARKKWNKLLKIYTHRENYLTLKKKVFLITYRKCLMDIVNIK